MRRSNIPPELLREMGAVYIPRHPVHGARSMAKRHGFAEHQVSRAMRHWVDEARPDASGLTKGDRAFIRRWALPHHPDRSYRRLAEVYKVTPAVIRRVVGDQSRAAVNDLLANPTASE